MMDGTLKLKPGQRGRRRKLGQGGGDDRAVFLPVDITGEVAGAEDLVKSPSCRIEIALSKGTRITVTGGFDPDIVARLVRGILS